MVIIKILAGDLRKGKQRIDPKLVRVAELQTEEKLKKLAGSAGWGFTGAIVGGLLTRGVGLAVGGLAGILSGGNKTDVCFSGELEDGRKFLAVTDKKVWQKILAVVFERNQVLSAQARIASAPTDNVSNQIDQGGNRQSLTQNGVETLSTQQKCLASAKSGDPKAIAVLINHSLRSKGVTAKINLKGTCLKIMLEADRLPDQEKFSSFLAHGIVKLNIDSLEDLKIFGKQTGEKLPAWSQDISLQSLTRLSTGGSDLPSKKRVDKGNSSWTPDKRINTSLSSSSGSSFTSTKHKDAQRAVKNDAWVQVKKYSCSSLMAVWRWYISGLKSRPDLPMYASPRFFRVLLTFFVFAFITAPFSSYQETASSSSLSTKSDVSNSGKASARICVDNLNTHLSPVATVTLDKANKKMNVVFDEAVTQQDLNELAPSAANSVFSGCSDTFIQSVSMSANGHIVTTNRP